MATDLKLSQSWSLQTAPKWSRFAPKIWEHGSTRKVAEMHKWGGLPAHINSKWREKETNTKEEEEDRLMSFRSVIEWSYRFHKTLVSNEQRQRR